MVGLLYESGQTGSLELLHCLLLVVAAGQEHDDTGIYSAQLAKCVTRRP